MTKPSSELEIRKQIYNLIEKNPGIRFTKIIEILKISNPLALYHLRYLYKQDLITIEKETGSTRFYIKGQTGVFDKKYISLLRQEILLKIVLYLLQHPYSKHKELIQQFNLAPSTISYHLKKLITNDIIKIYKGPKDYGYIVTDEKEIVKFLFKYKPSRIATGMKDTWDDFTIYWKKKNK